MFQDIGVGKHSVILMLILVSIGIIPNASAQFQPELIPSEQICEQLEISNRLYNPVTILMSYDKATIRTPEVIVSKSNPDAVVPIQILENNLNINTNATGRFVAKVDMMYANPSDQPRLVNYNIISGRGGIELERGTWLMDGKGFCKVITFTVTDEPHIPTVEEFASQAEQITSAKLEQNRQEQINTNNIMTLIAFAVIGLACAIVLGTVIGILLQHHDNITAKKLLEKLRKAELKLSDANTNMKLSREHNDLLNQGQREQNNVMIEWFSRVFPNIVAQLKSHNDDSLKNVAFAVDHAIKNNKPLEYESKQTEITVEPVPIPIKKPKINQIEYPKFVKDGLNLFEKGMSMIPDHPIKEKVKDMIGRPDELETFEEWYEYYNKNPSREELLKEYEIVSKEYEIDKLNMLKEAKARACYRVLINRESKLD